MDLTTKSPRRGLFLSLAIALGMVGTAGAMAPPAAEVPTPEQQQLKAAQERLEAAAREVAELSSKAGPGAPRVQVRIQRMGGPEQREVEVKAEVQQGGPGPMGGMGRMGGMALPDGHPRVGEFQRLAGFAAAGLRLAPLSPRLGSYFGAKGGVLVVKADNPSLKLEDGDVITSIGGREPASPAHAARILGSYEPGEKIPLKLLRDRKALSVEVTMPAQARRFELRRVEGGPSPMGSPRPAAAPHEHAHD